MTVSSDRLASVLPAEAALRAHKHKLRWAAWAAFALILVWGSNFSVQKAVFEALSPGGFLFVRYLIMPLAAAMLLCTRHGRRWPSLPRADVVALLTLGIAGQLLHVTLVAYGIGWVHAVLGSFD